MVLGFRLTPRCAVLTNASALVRHRGRWRHRRSMVVTRFAARVACAPPSGGRSGGWFDSAVGGSGRARRSSTLFRSALSANGPIARTVVGGLSLRTGFPPQARRPPTMHQRHEAGGVRLRGGLLPHLGSAGRSYRRSGPTSGGSRPHPCAQCQQRDGKVHAMTPSQDDLAACRRAKPGRDRRPAV